MTTGIVIQARLGSQRLPRKVMFRLPNGRTILDTVIDNCLLSKSDKVILTTPDSELVLLFSDRVECNLHVGPRDCVREYRESAEVYGLDIIVRVTADCPLIKPYLIDAGVELLKSSGADYVYNVLDGSDVEVFTIDSIRAADKCADQREHVGVWMKENLNCVKLDCPPLNVLSIDTMDDYERVCEIMEGV